VSGPGGGSEQFYRSENREQLSQGDLFMVPTSMIWSFESRPEALSEVPPLPPGVGTGVLTHAWHLSASGEPVAPAAVVETRWSPAMVLSHNCEIDKDFNEEVDRLVEEEGLGEDEAIRAAEMDWNLDRHISVAPLLAYQEIPGHKHPGVRSGQRIGYFPLPPIPGFGTSEFAVHLSRIATVERRLLRGGLKIASVAPDSVKRLQYKLAEVFASRRLSLLSELEAAIGREIVEVRTLKESRKKATVALVLDDGTDLSVETRPGPPGTPPERQRREGV
jgi:hypothetical protein